MNKACEFNAAVEMDSFHLLVSLGDAPIASLRARVSLSSSLSSSLSLSVAVLVDRLYVLPPRRGQKLSTYCIRAMLDYLLGNGLLGGSLVVQLVLAVPAESWMHRFCVERRGFREFSPVVEGQGQQIPAAGEPAMVNLVCEESVVGILAMLQ